MEDDNLREFQKLEIESNIHNLNEAMKLLTDKTRERYIRNLKCETDQLIRKVGRSLSYTKLNKDAYKQGIDWLESQGIVIE